MKFLSAQLSFSPRSPSPRRTTLSHRSTEGAAAALPPEFVGPPCGSLRRGPPTLEVGAAADADRSAAAVWLVFGLLNLRFIRAGTW